MIVTIKKNLKTQSEIQLYKIENKTLKYVESSTLQF